MNALITTILHRPYVFAFLFAYLILSVRRWGSTRSLLWLITGYGIAWLSEYSSINNGFPYGEYHYVYENLSGELLVKGVPFFDSLSYPFLIFAGFVTAEFIVCGFYEFIKRRLRTDVGWSRTALLPAIFLGAFLTMLLDVIIDPIATMGEKWFLGKIHYYTYPGSYFGVPMSNFGGWFLVSFVVIAFNVVLWRLLPGMLEAGDDPAFTLGRTKEEIHEQKSEGEAKDKMLDILYPAFFVAIALFNIFVTFYVGERMMGIISSAILAVIVIAVMPCFLSVRGRQKRLS